MVGGPARGDLRHRMKTQYEPGADLLDEMPEIDDQRFRRRPGRGHHANRSVGETLAIDADLRRWSAASSASS